jgi:hypothetical protein
MFCGFQLSAIYCDAKKMADRLEASNTAVMITGAAMGWYLKGSVSCQLNDDKKNEIRKPVFSVGRTVLQKVLALVEGFVYYPASYSNIALKPYFRGARQ